jgi:predicted ATPase
VRGYKSIRELEAFKLRNLNLLIGANGAGKSNFISLFRLLAEMVEQNLQVYVQRQGGPDALLHFGRKRTSQLHAEFYFGANGYFFDLVPTNDNRLIFENESSSFGGVFYSTDKTQRLGTGHAESLLREASDSYSPYVFRAIANWRVYHFHDTGETSRIKQRHALSDNLRLKPDAANLAAYLHLLREEHRTSYEQIVATIRLVAPFFGGFVVRDEPNGTVELEWFEQGDSDTPLKAHLLSDGTLRFICLTTLLLQPWERIPDTILIDEPELGLHPYAINVLADLIKRAAERRQLIISTQSVQLINNMEPEDIIVANRQNDETILSRLDEEELAGWLEDYSLGDLWQQAIIGGRPAL